MPPWPTDAEIVEKDCRASWWSRMSGNEGVSKYLEVARLQNEVGTKEFLGVTNSLTKHAPNLPEICRPLSCGSKKVLLKFLPDFQQDFPVENQRKFTQTRFCMGTGEK